MTDRRERLTTDSGTVVLVGAGLGGSLMAILLGRAGYRVRCFEMRPDPRAGSPRVGRSINLAISARAIHALGTIGLAKDVLAVGIPMRGRMIHDLNGRTVFQPYGTVAEHANYSVSRAELNIALLNAAAALPNVEFRFGMKCAGVDPEAGIVTFAEPGDSQPESGRRETAVGDVIIGADGAFSTVRQQIQRQDRFDYQQSFLSHGYKELTLPPGDGGGFALDRNALHIWPRGGFMMIALPNRDGSFTCTLFWPLEGANSFAALRTGEEVRRFFTGVFPDAARLMPDLEAEYIRNPVGSLVTVRCSPWRYGARVVLLGDACHAVVPFHGQGANAAFEDCVVLDECIRSLAPDWSRVFSSFEALRRENTDALADLSIANFEEMRDHAGSRAFRLKKGLEKGLHRLFPSWFIPLYMMISFTRIPYAAAVRRARRQARVVAAIAGAAFLFILMMLYRSL
ncbi:MAG: NAD(P)/FAD-dependent oxidoreductase [Acidobacteria bacterium]|nr:NAD(P)/FAD-dependent oxidoreductase [Acidobacteriota bacterium]